MALTYIGPPKTRTNLLSTLLKHLKESENENEVVIVYDDSLDALGHMFGPHSRQCLDYAKSLDTVLAEIYPKLENAFQKNFAFFVFSDHGQSEMSHQINLLSNLSKQGLRLGVDYLCFLDATLALFWPEDDGTKERILKVLGRIEKSKVIDEDCRKKYHINFGDDRYGEVIFVLEPGSALVPNFYSPYGTMKGLHGYSTEEEVQKAFLISNRKLSFHPVHVKDIKRLLLTPFS
jgi:hypothetical protein